MNEFLFVTITWLESFFDLVFHFFDVSFVCFWLEIYSMKSFLNKECHCSLHFINFTGCHLFKSFLNKLDHGSFHFRLICHSITKWNLHFGWNALFILFWLILWICKSFSDSCNNSLFGFRLVFHFFYIFKIFLFSFNSFLSDNAS